MTDKTSQGIETRRACFDPSGWLMGSNGIPRPVDKRYRSVLKLLVERQNTCVKTSALNAVRKSKKVALRYYKSGINDIFEKAAILDWAKIIGTEREGFELSVQGSFELTGPKPVGIVSDRTRSGQLTVEHSIEISLDSSLVNQVSVLLFNDGGLDSLIRTCFRSYRRSLEDFAFAVLYASQIATGSRFRQGFGEIIDKRLLLLRQLGPLWTHQAISDQYRDGAILTDNLWRKQIRADIESVSRCLEFESWPFRDWMKYEAYRHLGRHDSLLDPELPFEQYEFNVATNPYYSDTELLNALDEPSAARLAGFLREGIDLQRDAFAERALRHYVRRNVLTNVAVMREYDVMCQDQGRLRISQSVRNTVLRETSYDESFVRQRSHRNFMVQHGLFTAFRDVHSIDRHSLVTVLLRMRNEPTFVKIRELLQTYGPRSFQSDHEKEMAAEKFRNEIVSYAKIELVAQDPREFDEHRILKSIGTSMLKVSAMSYEAELWRVFPELNPNQSVEIRKSNI
jgi:hypothetical protein